MSEPNQQPSAPQADFGPVPPHRVTPPAAPAEPVPLRPEHLYKAAGLLFLLALIYRFFDPLVRVLLVAYASAILAVALNVVVGLVPYRRRWVTAALGVLIVGALGAAIWFGSAALVGQVRSFSSQLPEFQRQLQEWSEWLRAQTGLNIDLLGERAQQQLRQIFGGIQGNDMLGRAGGLLEALFIPLLILFGALFAVGKPNERLLSPLLRAVPRDRRLAFRRMFELLGSRLRGWVKGTLLAMLGVGALSIASFYLLGLPYALLLGLLNGVTEFIPIIGPWIGGTIAVVVAFLDDPSKAAWTALVVLAIQQVESNLITPWAMSRAAEVHPFVTLFALFLFGSLFGFLGLLLSVPLVLLIWTLVEVLWVERAIDTDEDMIAPVVRE